MTSSLIPLRAFAAVLGLLALLAGPATAGPRPVLVELFTSQGCSSCPPADETLGRLAGRDGVVALSLHVDYWDYLGWKDTFAQGGFTERQYGYRQAFDARVVYTPQTVVQGAAETVGTDRAGIDALIEGARAVEGMPALSIDTSGQKLAVRLAPGSARRGGELWVARYDRSATVEIARGENAGREITYRNVVLSLSPAGRWDGVSPAVFDVARPAKGEGVAVWLQRADFGPVLAVDKAEF